MRTSVSSIPQRVRKKLKFYVYLYVHPRTKRPFYVGKGQGDRVYAHLNDKKETRKVEMISEIRKLDLEPELEILKHGLDEKQALLVESAAIDLLGINNLTNEVKGHGASQNGRVRLKELIQELDAEPATIMDNVLLINISNLYRHGMSEMELYDATRGIWKVGKRRWKAEYALSVHGGIVREVYKIAIWLPAGSTKTTRNDSGRLFPQSGRQEFVGDIASNAVRRRYVGKSVRQYLPRGAQNPIKYVNCD